MARIAYGEVSPSDRVALDRYISSLAATEISGYSRAEQFAYWVNLYNALTVQVVLQHYPVASIRDIDISPGLLSDGPWGKTMLTIEGNKIRLNDIEHRILRPIWGDPRIHYLLNCASVGCPNLSSLAVTAENSERLLEQAARDYVNHPRGVTVSEGRLILSSLYNWFEDDFTGDGGVLNHIRRYARPELWKRVQEIEAADDFVYDWSLNDTAGASARSRHQANRNILGTSD